LHSRRKPNGQDVPIRGQPILPAPQRQIARPKHPSDRSPGSSLWGELPGATWQKTPGGRGQRAVRRARNRRKASTTSRPFRGRRKNRRRSSGSALQDRTQADGAGLRKRGPPGRILPSCRSTRGPAGPPGCTQAVRLSQNQKRHDTARQGKAGPKAGGTSCGHGMKLFGETKQFHPWTGSTPFGGVVPALRSHLTPAVPALPVHPPVDLLY